MGFSFGDSLFCYPVAGSHRARCRFSTPRQDLDGFVCVYVFLEGAWYHCLWKSILGSSFGPCARVWATMRFVFRKVIWREANS